MIIKYRFSSFMIIMAISLIMIMTYYLSINILRNRNERVDIINNRLSNCCIFECYPLDEFSELDDKSESDYGSILNMVIPECRITMIEMPIYVDSIAMTSFMINVDISNDTALDYPVIEGTYFNDNDAEYECLVGRGYKGLGTIENGSEYFYILGERYKVSGYISATNSAIYDYIFVLDSQKLGNNFRTNLKGLVTGINIMIESDSLSRDEIIESFSEKCKDANFSVSLCDYLEENLYASEVDDKRTVQKYFFFVDSWSVDTIAISGV